MLSIMQFRRLYVGFKNPSMSAKSLNETSDGKLKGKGFHYNPKNVNIDRELTPPRKKIDLKFLFLEIARDETGFPLNNQSINLLISCERSQFHLLLSV